MININTINIGDKVRSGAHWYKIIGIHKEPVRVEVTNKDYNGSIGWYPLSIFNEHKPKNITWQEVIENDG